MTDDTKKAWAIHQLRRKQAELGRLPKKDDFDDVNKSRIKAFLGPWPRALETAGLKTAKVEPPKSKKRKKSGKAGRRGTSAPSKTQQDPAPEDAPEIQR